MSGIIKAFVGASIHDGQTLHTNHVLLAMQDGCLSLAPRAAVPDDCPIEQLDGGVICPGFVDLQVNGGGGVMLGDDPSIETLRTMADAHLTSGVTALMPTLITDTPAQTARAIDAVAQAITEGCSGIAGLHLEGPHLCVARKGAHDAALIRTMSDDDLAVLLNAADRIANIIVTVAPENVTNAQIKTMADAGIVVSLGHTDADFTTCLAAFDAGARAVTHLFNAMSQMTPRAAGLVGATLTREDIYAGIIADGIHVQPDMIRIALAAKPNPDRVFLVSDAMAVAGTSARSFSLGGRDIQRRNGRLTLADGTLAGADLNMPRAISVMVDHVGDDQARAIARATSTPAELLRDRGDIGCLISTSKTAVYLASDTCPPRVITAT